MGFHSPFYSFANSEGYDYDALINKYRIIDKHQYDRFFDKSELKEINNTGLVLQEKACDECEEMIKAASKENIKLKLISAFISAEDQKILYEEAVEKYGVEEAELIVERPGHSYAQIGTKVVFDVEIGSKEEKWLKKCLQIRFCICSSKRERRYYRL